MLNKFIYAIASLLILVSNDAFCQGKLVEVHPQNPSGAALSTGLNHLFLGDKVNVLISENFKNFGSPAYSVFYLQQYDYDLNLIQEEPIRDFNYTDTIFSQDKVIGGSLTNNSGFFIYVEGINDSAEKSYFEVRDSSSTIVFAKIDAKLLDVPLFSKSRNYLHDFALIKNNRLIQVSKTGVENASFDLDSLESELLNNYFSQADSVKLQNRLAAKPSSNKNYYSLLAYKNGLDTYYNCSFDYNFQLLDSIRGQALNDYRIENYQDEIVLMSDSTVIDSSSSTFQTFYQFRDFDFNVKFSFQTSGRVIYSYFGPTNSEQWIFDFNGALNLVNGENFIKPLDTTLGYRVRYYDSTGTQELDHLFYEDGIPISTSGLSTYSTFGRSALGEFIVPIRAWRSNSLLYYSSYLLKIDAQGSSPLSIHVLEESKVVDVYPNPSKNWLKINTHKSGERFKIKIFDLQGQLVFQQDGVSEQQMNISELPYGTYYIQIKGDKDNWLNTYWFIKN
jgi:hypothetical protein